MQKGRESDGIYLPPALLFTLSNVDIDRFYGFKLGRPDEYQAIIDLAAEQGYRVCRWYDFDETSLPGVVNVNNGGLPGWETLDMTRPEDRTIAERMGVQAAVDFANFARKLKMPGMEDCHLVRAGYQAAVRDTRRIAGEYLITHEDALNAPEFEDIVSRRYGFIDAVGYYQAEMVSGKMPVIPIAACCRFMSKGCSWRAAARRRRTLDLRPGAEWANAWGWDRPRASPPRFPSSRASCRGKSTSRACRLFCGTWA